MKTPEIDISLFANLDCGDNSCKYKKSKGGMRTNGGCRCARNHPNDVEQYLNRKCHQLELMVESYRARLSKLGVDLDGDT